MTPLMSTHHKHLEGGQKEWEYFEHELVIVHGVPKVICKYCKLKLTHTNKTGTNSLRTYIAEFAQKLRLMTNRFVATMKKQPSETSFVFDLQRTCELITKFSIHAEIPFQMFGDPYFKELIESMQPTFSVFGRHTLRNDSICLYERMKHELCNEFQSLDSRICLTLDLWTSVAHVHDCTRIPCNRCFYCYMLLSQLFYISHQMKEAFGPPTSVVTTTPEPEDGTFSCMRNNIAERDSISSYQRCMRPGNSMKCEADTHFLSHANSAVSHQIVDLPRGRHFVDEATSFSSRWCFDNGGPSLPRGLEYGDEIPSLSSQKCNGNVALSYSSQWEYGAEIPSLSSRQGYGAEIPSLSSTQGYGAEIPSLSSRQGYGAEIPLLSSRQGYGDEIPSLSRHWRYRDKLTLHSSQWCHDAEAHPLPSYQQGTYRNGHSRDKFVSSLVSNQQVKMIISKHTVARPRVPNRVVNSTDHYRINKKDNPWRNSEDIQDQVRGPRANKLNNSSTPSTEKDIVSPMVRRDQINRSDFSVQYEHAKFFIIKSYSEDDIHKGIKYNVWASTPNGNNKLDAAFHEAQILMKEKGTKCPVFLFFSVNTSGQFVGLAEMLGPVDFKKTMDFWQQDKWNGFFPVMWHIMKDIPNRLFKHITLENNHHRPVTFSKDTQEIGLPQGLEMLKIFKAYRHGTSILDDFNFYEKENAHCARKGTNADSIHEARHTFLGKEASLSDDFKSMENLEASMESMNFYETWD